MEDGPTGGRLASPEDLDGLFRRIEDSKLLVYDSETDGLDWRTNRIVGHVFTFSAKPQDSWYVPVGHASGKNIPRKKFHDKLRKTWARCMDGTMVMHNAAFDLSMLANESLEYGGRLEDTMINAALIDELQGKYNLAYCCQIAGVQPKKGDRLYQHLAAKFGGEVKQSQMGNFWKLAADDPLGVDYATGDGTSTWQLRDKQIEQITAQDLTKVWDIECRLIPILARLTRRGIRVDEERLEQLLKYTTEKAEQLRAGFFKDFNEKSPIHMKRLFTDAGITDWPMTPKGAASFPEVWLKTTPVGQRVIQVRKLSHMKNSFLDPIKERHLFNGRVHGQYTQLKQDDYGTVTGRLSMHDPNMQQAHKRNKELGPLFRSLFLADEGMVWGSVDYSQCLAAGTKVTIPGGVKNIEDMKIGDWVYGFDNNRNLALRQVTWSGKTGVRKLYRLHWMTNGRTVGHLDVTDDHKIRMRNGEYITVADLMKIKPGKKSKHECGVSVMALRREMVTIRGTEKRNHLRADGYNRTRESRFVFKEIYGWEPDEVHHKDGNSLNDHPDNLEGLDFHSHQSAHSKEQWAKLSKEERIRRSRVASDAARAKFKGVPPSMRHAQPGNHFITCIEPLPGKHVVYDITVDDIHNFIANEICVHNCEPRLLAFYGNVRALIEGYRADPPIDAHMAVTVAADIIFPDGRIDPKTGKYDRETGKRINQALLTGAGNDKIASMLDMPYDRAIGIVHRYFHSLPEIKLLQDEAKRRMRSRGYVASLLGRRARLEDPRFAYRAVNRLLQCGNADILKLKMVEIDDFLKVIGRPVDLLNNVHDAFDFQFPEEGRAAYRQCLQIMKALGPGDVINLTIPGSGELIPMEIEEGDGINWAEATWGRQVVEEAFQKQELKYA